MASTKYCLDGASQSDTSEPQSQDSAASFEDQIRFVTDSDCLKKKLFADGNDSEEDSISCTPPASLNDARGIANLDREERSSLFVDRSEMEWDNHFATPKVNKRRGMRRSLEQSDDDDDAMFMTPPPKQHRIDETPCTPNGVASTSPLIHQGLQQLTLFDTPHTPKSLIRRASFQAMVQQTPLDAVKQVQARGSRSRVTALSYHPLPDSGGSRSAVALCRKVSKGTNVNPFTPQELHSLSRTHAEPTPLQPFQKPQGGRRLALKDSNISRYNAEFHEECQIGSGTFGTVYKCINRLDGCCYALKKSRRPVAGSSNESAALKEVYAHAVLGAHQHIVRYYSAWAEDNHMIIQNEYCNGGNLSRKVAENRENGLAYSEEELKHLMRHLVKGLHYIHSRQLVHLDIKPENVFLTFADDASYLDTSDSGICCTPDGTLDDNEGLCMQDTAPLPVYKIGDMGHVTSVHSPQVEEGDCRYLPREILLDDYSCLPKADIFSLGLVVFVVGSGEELPKNGDRWHQIRDGTLPDLPQCSVAFNNLLKSTISPNPHDRPSASQLLSHSLLSSPTDKSKADLQRELKEEKLRNVILQRELQQVRNSKGSSQECTTTKLTVGGKRTNRSMSVNIF